MNWDALATILEAEVRRFEDPVVTQMTRVERDPFKILVATLLSLRTRDQQTREASRRLFQLAETPESLVNLPGERIAEAIYPVGFYRTKARTLLAVCRVLLDDHQGKVPSDMEALLALPGVGRKTANLVRTQGFGLPGICVDTHVHRICNRLGVVVTKSPDETEMELRRVLPKRYWIPINDLLVTWGQNVCHPLSPRCSQCAIYPLCARKGVLRSR